jgi:hypothetical protein
MPSDHEVDLYALLKQNMFAALELQLEVYKLPGWAGAVDVFLPAYNLALMVDGEGHFLNTSTGQKKRAAAQQVVSDHVFNSKVLVQPAGEGLKGVVRLHYLDKGWWWFHILRGIAAAQQEAHFVLFSKSYKYIDLFWK